MYAINLFIEGEDFDNLSNFPCYNLEEQGWYARETSCRHYGSPGEGYSACIHENAKNFKMVKILSNPLPPGQYNIFLRVDGHSLRHSENILEVVFGEKAKEIKWKHRANRWLWIGPLNFNPKDKVKKIEIIAKQFGGEGNRILYEVQCRTILLDTVFITSDLSITPDKINNLYFPVKFPSYEIKQAQKFISVPPGKETKGNLIPNSSFELGMNNGWAEAFGCRDIHILSDENLEQKAFHGNFSLSISSPVFSKLFYLPEDGKVTLSVYVFSEKDVPVKLSLYKPSGNPRKVRSKPLIFKKGKSENSWKRLSVSGNIKKGWYFVRIEPEDITQETKILIDAMQLEYGKLTEYKPMREIEGSITTGEYANILYPGSPLILRFFNNSRRDRKATLYYEVIDIFERVIRKGKTKPVIVKAKSGVKLILDLKLPVGIFSVLYGMEGVKPPDNETVAVVVPAPEKGKALHELGANMDDNPAVYRAMKKAGFNWQLYCKMGNLINLSRAHPDPNTFIWFDKEVKEAEPFGLKTTLLLLHRLPEWMVNKNYISKITRGRRTPYPDLNLFGDYVLKTVSRYKDVVKEWCVMDEVEGSYVPEDYASIVETAVRSAKKADTKSKVYISATPSYTEELFKYVNPEILDGLGGSSFSLDLWQARKVWKLKQMYNKTWYCIGVGLNEQPSFYHTHPWYRGALKQASKTARLITFLCAVQGADIVGHYTGRLNNLGEHFTFDYPLMDYDGTLLPHGATYAIVGANLKNAVPVEQILFEGWYYWDDSASVKARLSPIAIIFKNSGRMEAALWGNNRFLNLKVKNGDIEVRDMYFNPINMRWRNNLKIQLTETPVFILNKRMKEDEFINMFKNGYLEPEPVDFTMGFVNDKNGNICLGVRVQNNTGKSTNKLKLSFSSDWRKRLTRTKWIPKKGEATVPSISPGKSHITLIPTNITGRKPVEVARFRMNVFQKDKFLRNFEDTCYLLNCIKLKKSPVIDGNIAEWDNKWSGWIFVTYAWARMGRNYFQVLENGENFKEEREKDCLVQMWSGYDKKNLYFAFRVYDDSFVFADKNEKELSEKISIKISKNPFLNYDKNPFTLTLIPYKSGEIKVISSIKIPVRASFKTYKNFYAIEIKIPLKNFLNLSKTKIIGFNCIVQDVDIELGKKFLGKLQWAGASKGGGQLCIEE